MEIIYSENPLKILKNKKKLEKDLKIDISNRGKEIIIKGDPENEYYVRKIIEALNFGFSFSKAILMHEKEFVFESINIKDYTKRNDLERIRARIIGTKGKTLKTLSQLTDCFLEIKDNEIGIIGNPENIQNAQKAIISLIRGSKQSNVYKYLEKHHPKEVIDLGLKESFEDEKI